jgi:hypothetical protein
LEETGVSRDKIRIEQKVARVTKGESRRPRNGAKKRSRKAAKTQMRTGRI